MAKRLLRPVGGEEICVKWLALVGLRLVFTASAVGLGLLAGRLFKFIGAPWLILLWPVAAAVSENRNRSVEAIAIWNAMVASYVAWGVVTGFWYPPHRSLVALFSGPSWLPWAGWGLWVLSVIFGLVAAGVSGQEHRFDAYSFAPWPARHRQASYVLAFFGLWMIGYGGHSLLLPLIITTLGAVHGSEIFGAPSSNHGEPASRRTGAGGTAAASDTTGPPLVTIDGQTGNADSGALPGASPLPLTELRQAPDGGTVVVPRREVLGRLPATPTPATETVTEPARPVDDGSARAAAAWERAALRRAAWFDQFLGGKLNRELLWSLQDQARTARDDATRWQVAGLARLRREVKLAQRVTATEPVRPLTKNCLPALLPMIHPADFRTLERWAVRVGAAVRLGNGRTLNALGERWPMQRIDAELPAVPLPQLIDVWLRTRALLAPDRLPGDDDWSWAREAPGEATAHPTAEFTIAMDGEVAIPARLVDVSDLRWLEELYAVEGSWTARQEAGGDAPTAGSDRWQAVQVAPADQRLLERHAFAIGASIGFEDGREVNARGERWSRQRIDAELPRLPDGGLV